MHDILSICRELKKFILIEIFGPIFCILSNIRFDSPYYLSQTNP